MIATPSIVTPVEDLVADDFMMVLLAARGGRLTGRDEAFLPVELAGLVASERVLRGARGDDPGEDPLRLAGFQADGPGAFSYRPVEPASLLERGLARGRLEDGRERLPPFRRRTLPVPGHLEALRESTLRALPLGPDEAPLAYLLTRAASRWSILDALAGPETSSRILVERAARQPPPSAVIPLIRAAWHRMRDIRAAGMADAEAR